MKFSGILEIPSGISPEMSMFCLIWQYGIFFPLNFSHRAQILVLLEFLWNSGIYSGIWKNWLRVWYGVSIPLSFKHWVQLCSYKWQFHKNEGIEKKYSDHQLRIKIYFKFLQLHINDIWAVDLNSVLEMEWNWHPISYPKTIFFKFH